MECCVCSENGKATSFQTNFSLQAHIASTHCKPNLYMCDGCLKSFVSEYGLLKHLQNSCGKGFRTAELDARIDGKLELYKFMEKSINVSLNKKLVQENRPLSPNKKSKVVPIRVNAEPALVTQLQEEHPGSSNEQRADTFPNGHNPEVGSNDVPDQSSPMEPEPSTQTEPETHVEIGSHAENDVSNVNSNDVNTAAESDREREKLGDYFGAFSDEDDVVVVEENIKHYGEKKDQSKESISPGGSMKELRENRAKTARPSRRQVARAQAIAAGILQVNPGGMSNPKEKIPNTYYKNYATNTNNKSSVGHRILVTGMNTEGLKDAKICEMLKGYFEQFGEINQIVIIRNPITKEPNGTAQIRFSSLDGRSKAIKKKMHTIGTSKCEVRKAWGEKDGKWYYDQNDKCWYANQPFAKKRAALENFKQNQVRQDRSFGRSSGNRPPLLRYTRAESEILFQRNQSPSIRSVQAENEILLRGIRESWRNPQSAAMYAPGMITPGMLEHRSMYMETRMREPNMSGYLPDSRFGEPRTAESHGGDRIGGHDHRTPYNGPVFSSNLDYGNRSLMSTENRNDQSVFPSSNGNRSLMSPGRQGFPSTNTNFNYYQTPGTSRNYNTYM
ncbi:RNA recognition motif domain-containing protein [Ditylenchus destructor]|uniref:RNA recognition motif domain-containing protein n=1 Tax=Ditylenchus destructor TaxID=166010 RepID=A0AAD4R585_9BILA|nr:RNA recognition motif domain-containing protein [Ditylenchus destructor]